MKILITNFSNIMSNNNESSKFDCGIISKECFCGCDWHGCDCEYNCGSDDDCTSDRIPSLY